MPANPVYSDTITMKASAFNGFHSKAAIDRGLHLTKVLFVPRDIPSPDEDTVTLTCLTFPSERFEDALHTMKQQADLEGAGDLHVTGAIDVAHTAQIKTILGLDAVLVDGNDLRGRGVFLLLDSPAIDANFHPQLTEKGFIMEMFEEDFNRFKRQLPQEEVAFPALVINIGSDSEIYVVSKEGRVRFSGRAPIAGESITGLANLMMGITRYDDLMELASGGNRTKVDLLVKDVMDMDINTEFGNLPPDLPIFPFSKCSEPDWSEEKCDKSDIAQALVALVPAFLETSLYGLIFTNGVNCLYVTGNFFRAEIARKVFYQKMSTITDQMGIKIKFIKTDHSKAIAAMLTNKGEEKSFVEASKVDTMLQFL